MGTSSKMKGFISEERKVGLGKEVCGQLGSLVNFQVRVYWKLLASHLKDSLELRNKERRFLWRVQDKLLQKESGLRALRKEGKFAWNLLKRLKTQIGGDYDNILVATHIFLQICKTDYSPALPQYFVHTRRIALIILGLKKYISYPR